MNFLGMGPMEIAVIAIVGLMIFGPGKLPEVAGQVGKAVRDFKRMTADLSSEFEKTAGLDEIKKTVQKEMAGIQSEVNSVTSGVKKDLTSTTSATKKSATPTGSTTSTAAKTTTSSGTNKTVTPANKPTTSKTTTPAKVEPAKPSKADPLADFAVFAQPAAKSAVPVAVASSAASNGSAAPETGDALARARARRMTAGYNRTQA
jgi:TatA/E family protein of Tat protein translocase